MVTGTSVVSVTFADGVMLAADTLGESRSTSTVNSGVDYEQGPTLKCLSIVSNLIFIFCNDDLYPW